MVFPYSGRFPKDNREKPGIQWPQGKQRSTKSESPVASSSTPQASPLSPFYSSFLQPLSSSSRSSILSGTFPIHCPPNSCLPSIISYVLHPGPSQAHPPLSLLLCSLVLTLVFFSFMTHTTCFLLFPSSASLLSLTLSLYTILESILPSCTTFSTSTSQPFSLYLPPLCDLFAHLPVS